MATAINTNDFIYPEPKNITRDIMLRNPHDGILSLLPSKWFLKGWIELIENVNKYIIKKFDVDTEGNGIIRKGTKLYHGSLNDDIDFTKFKNKITFFGIDIIISLWYIYELQCWKTNLKNGTIYEFVVTNDINVVHLSNLYKHPKEQSICKKSACIHPQTAFHGSVQASPPYDLSIEFTMNVFNNPDNIKLIRKHTVNANLLRENVRKLSKEFNPVSAIINSVNIDVVSLKPQQIARKTQKKGFLNFFKKTRKLSNTK